RLGDELVAERPDLVRPALPDFLRPADGGREPLAAERVDVLDRPPPHLPEALLAAIELAVGARQIARLHRRLVLLADHADERAGVRVDVEYLVALVGDGGGVDRDDADGGAPVGPPAFELREAHRSRDAAARRPRGGGRGRP